MEDSSLAIAVLLPIALAIIMVSLGMSLTPADFKRVVQYPRGVGIGLANLLLLSPVLAFAIAELYSLSPEFAVGLVLLGASPGGTTANLLTHLAKGDTALSITMTAISSVAAVITVPLFLNLSTGYFDASAFDEEIGMAGIVARVLLITIVPLSIGMYLRHRDPVRIIALEPRFKKVAFAVFLVAVVGAVASEAEEALENLGELAAATVTLNVVAMTLSFGIARAAGLDERQSTAIAMELGIHNATLAIAVGGTIATVLTLPAAVYSSFMFISAGIFAWIMYRRNDTASELEASRLAPS